MKILELTNFSSGICGVWQRVKQESELLQKRGHQVKIFSSNLTKGSEEIAPSNEQFQGIQITRFPAKKLGGESFLTWDFEKAALDFRPDIIIAHSYRHKHTTKALKIAKKTNSKVFLVTHAPFIKNDSTRSFLSKVVVKFYDHFLGKRILNKFDGVFAITQWEIPTLQSIGLKKEKIFYSPNGVPDEFFETFSKKYGGKNILFLGRIAPIKDLETLVKAIKPLSKEKITLRIVGPGEMEYSKKIRSLVKELNLEKKIVFEKPVYDLNEKIKLFQSSDIFVLPSISEAMPQSLIEAMASGNLVISSDNSGAKEIIDSGKNGFLFKIGDSKELSERLVFSINKKNLEKINQMLIESKKKSVQFKWSNLIDSFEKILISNNKQ